MLVVLHVGKGILRYVVADPAMQCIASVDVLYNVLVMYRGSTWYCVIRRHPFIEGPRNKRCGMLRTNHQPRQCHLDEVLHPASCKNLQRTRPFPEFSMISPSKKRSVLSSWTLSSYLAIKTVSKVISSICFLSTLIQLLTHPCPWLPQQWLWCSLVAQKEGA